MIEAQSLGTFHDRNPLSAASTDPLMHDTNPLPVASTDSLIHGTNPLPVASTAPFYSVAEEGEGGGVSAG